MKIGITGLGHVGRSIRAGLPSDVGVVTFDLANGGSYPGREMATVDLEFICVGTPPNPDGSCDITQIEAALAQSTAPLVVLKSTVPPSTTDSIVERTKRRIAFSPEFFGEGPMSSPFWNDRDAIGFTIVAGDAQTVDDTISVLQMLEPSSHRFFHCTATEAELIKYFENSYLAAKVALFNEFFDLTLAVGADWDRTREGLLLDPRIGESHTVVTEERGFGGRCFPKDTAALLDFADSIGVDLTILRAAVSSNNKIRSGDESRRR
jgi:nucleotide sugar dehydrogenase